MDIIIKKYNPEVFAIEEIQQQINVSTFQKLAELKGVVENNLFNKEYLYFIIRSSEWKSTCEIKGKKRDEQKANAQKFVKEKFNIKVDSDTADAICIGWHIVIKILPKIERM